MMPKLGKIVIYRLNSLDAKQINRRRTTGGSIADRIKHQLWPIGAQAHIGAEVQEGQEFPMIVVKMHDNVVYPENGWINGQVMLDGNDVFWIEGRREGCTNGTFYLAGL